MDDHVQKSDKRVSDLLAVASSSGLVAKGVGMRVFNSNAVPQRVKSFIVDAMIKQFPNFVARESIASNLGMAANKDNNQSDNRLLTTSPL